MRRGLPRLGMPRLISTATALLLAVVALMAFGPLLGISDGLNAFLTLFAGFAFLLIHGSIALGWRNVIAFLVITIAFSFSSEALGVATGWVFGSYHYTDNLGFKLLGVPPMIQVAYASMGYASLMMARIILRVVGESPSRWSLLPVCVVGAFVMVAWDVVMDPYQSTVGGDWIWKEGGPYFGIGLHNYVGWFATVFGFMFLYQLYASFYPERPSELARSRLFWSQAVLYYAFIALSIILVPWVGGVDLPYASPGNYDGPVPVLANSLTLIAIFAMGTPVVIALSSLMMDRGRAGETR